jgi:hypothetical protein
MVALPQAGTPFEYALFVLSVTLTTLILLALGGIGKWFFSHHKHNATFRKKFWIFPLFIASIFLMGWLSSLAQTFMYAYLKQNIATSISGLAIAVLIAWVLYDWAVWRRG